LGNGFDNCHQLVQWYSYTGVYGGTLWVWTVNILGFLFYWQKKHQLQAYSQKLIGLLIAAITIVPIAATLVQYSTYDEPANHSQVVVVQPTIDPYGKSGYIAPEEPLENLISLSESVAQPNTEFFIWPETAISSRGGINEEDFRQYPAYERIVNFLGKYFNG